MPEYAYRCTECGHDFNVTKRIAEASREEGCPKCGRRARKIWSAPGIAGSACASADTASGGG